MLKQKRVPKHPYAQDQKNEKIFYYQKGKEASFDLPKGKQYKTQYNNAEEMAKHDLGNELLHQRGVLVLNAKEKTYYFEEQKNKNQ